MGIKRVGTVTVFVDNQERARKFYTESLGMEVRADHPLFSGSSTRWLVVAPPGSETEIVLYQPDDNWQHYRYVMGKIQALSLEVSDMPATEAELRSRGVAFIQSPKEETWGTYAVIQDSEGNDLLLVERVRSLAAQ